MRRKSWILLLLAMISGGAAGYLALTYLREIRSVRTPSVSRAQVAVAARDLPVGALLTEGDVKLVEWPAEAMPAGYVGSSASLVGRGLIMAVRTNEPLLLSKVAPEGAGGGLSAAVPDGMRAVSVKVDEVIGVAGFVVPGSRVDVLVSLNPTAERDAMSRIVLQNVETLAAGQSTQRSLDGKPQTETVITLLVTPDQAERLTLAATTGRIQLALRNTLDLGVVETPGVSTTGLISPSRPERPAPRSRPAPPTVEVFRGAERTVTTVH